MFVEVLMEEVGTAQPYKCSAVLTWERWLHSVTLGGPGRVSAGSVLAGRAGATPSRDMLSDLVAKRSKSAAQAWEVNPGRATSQAG